MSNFTKNLSLLAYFLLFITFASNAQQDGKFNPGPQKAINPEKKAKVTEDVVLPNDFPKFVDTGNSIEDAETFKNAKIQWYASHPVEAEKLNGEKFSQEIKKSDFDKLPSERKLVILNNPSRFKIVE